jgi:hypothetical protein
VPGATKRPRGEGRRREGRARAATREREKLSLENYILIPFVSRARTPPEMSSKSVLNPLDLVGNVAMSVATGVVAGVGQAAAKAAAAASGEGHFFDETITVRGARRAAPPPPGTRGAWAGGTRGPTRAAAGGTGPGCARGGAAEPTPPMCCHAHAHRIPLSSPPFRAQPERIKHLLDNVELGTGKANIMEKIDGMKYLLAVRGVARAGPARGVPSA